MQKRLRENRQTPSPMTLNGDHLEKWERSSNISCSREGKILKLVDNEQVASEKTEKEKQVEAEGLKTKKEKHEEERAFDKGDPFSYMPYVSFL